jgi:hypothetical protein
VSTTSVETPWELSSDDVTVTARTPAGPVAEARVSESGERVVVEFWAQPPALPRELAADLVARAFALPAVRPRRPVLLCVPRCDGELLLQARRFVQRAEVRAAGTTCLIEGIVGAVRPSGPGSLPRPRPAR